MNIDRPIRETPADLSASLRLGENIIIQHTSWKHVLVGIVYQNIIIFFWDTIIIHYTIRLYVFWDLLYFLIWRPSGSSVFNSSIHSILPIWNTIIPQLSPLLSCWGYNPGPPKKGFPVTDFGKPHWFVSFQNYSISNISDLLPS